MLSDERIAEIRERVDAYSGLQYVVTNAQLQWPWTSAAATNQIVDLVRSMPDLLDALAASQARAEALEAEGQDWDTECMAYRRIARAYVALLESDYPESHWGENYHQAVALLDQPAASGQRADAAPTADGSAPVRLIGGWGPDKDPSEGPGILVPFAAPTADEGRVE